MTETVRTTRKIEQFNVVTGKKLPPYVGDMGTMIAQIDNSAADNNVEELVRRLKRRVCTGDITWKKELTLYQIINFGDVGKNEELVEAITSLAPECNANVVWLWPN